jgi:hypothetical protein
MCSPVFFQPTFMCEHRDQLVNALLLRCSYLNEDGGFSIGPLHWQVEKLALKVPRQPDSRGQ